MEGFNAFEILGIKDKELPVSNLLAFYLRPENGMGTRFINKFCNVLGIPSVDVGKQITVQREYFIQNEGKDNSIDILILVGDVTNPERIICIENKVYSDEGHEQTKRYVSALNKEFPSCKDRQYIYLTKDNSAVDLSSHSFIHFRYYELEPLFGDLEFQEFPLIKDFFDYYITKDKKRFESELENTLPVNTENYEELIDYIVYKLNRIKENGKCPYFCSRGKSAMSSDLFYQVSKYSWDFTYEEIPLTFHLESSNGAVALHFERKPYVPFGKLGEDRVIMERVRDISRKIFKQMTIDEVDNLRIRANAELTVAKYQMKGKTFGEYVKGLLNLVSMVDEGIGKTINII
ncbi:MAG: PD-(D/E)XK nuclease family protein [Lachnospiraceae bacterium]|nr:PD-(D/E)XK nuclease family protein [Lachnospiraceae bacterium]